MPLFSTERLSNEVFSTTGNFVIEYSDDVPSLWVNQGSARKIPKVVEMENRYHLSPSKRYASCNSNLFSCRPREFEKVCGQTIFRLMVMERHPFSTQTFIPLGRSKNIDAMIVIVANDKDGKPDVESIRVFVGKGDQGVMYGVNQWHAPMIALDETTTFSVVNWENGVAAEDCVEHWFDEDLRICIS